MAARGWRLRHWLPADRCCSTTRRWSRTRLAVRYDWAVGDTAVPGDYWADFEVTWGDGTVTTFPNSGYLEVRVVAELV